MAERRMFSKTIIDSDAFLDMPLSTQALYFHLSMRADDEGFINKPKMVMRMIGASQNELELLLAKRYLLSFDSGVVVIKHWLIHNYIQKDRIKKTLYEEEKRQITVKKNKSYTEAKNNTKLLMDTKCVQNGDIGKVRLGKISIDKNREEYKRAESLYLLHKKNIDQGYKVSDMQLQNWSSDIEKIHRLDGRSWEDIDSVITMIKTPGNFWNTNIMSGKKLREQFPRLIAQLKPAVNLKFNQGKRNFESFATSEEVGG